MFWALRNSGEDSNQAFSEGNHHISPKRNLRIGLTPAGGSGKGFLWQEGTVALGGTQRTWVRWWVARLRAPPGPPHCPARLGARPQPDPHVGSRTSAPLPPSRPDVNATVLFKAPPVRARSTGAAAAKSASSAARHRRPSAVQPGTVGPGAL